MLVFVYGTLTDPERVDAVVAEWSFEGDAVLEGLVRVDGRYPTLVPPDEDGSAARAEGRLLRTSDVGALDDYEGVDRGLYVRVAVPVEGRESGVAVYVGDPARLGVDESWPGSGSFPAGVREYVHERDVLIRPASRP